MGLFDWFRKPKPAPEPELPPVPAAPTLDDIQGALLAAESMVTTSVPTAVSSRVHKVTRIIRDTLPRLSNLSLGSSDSYSLMATATNYLPEALSAYLRLPRDWADSRPLVGGKTALMMLIDQLDLLGATMDKIYDAVVMADAEALIAHGRFLQEKFGHSSDVVDMNVATSPAPPQNPLEL